LASIWNKLLYSDITGYRIRAYPELSQFGDAKAQLKAYALAESAASRSKKLVFFLANAIPTFMFVVLCGLTIYLRRVGPIIWVCGTLVCIVTSYPLIRLHQKLLRHELRRLLNSALYCKKCDYNLMGNESGRCPECGTAITEEDRRLISLKSGPGLEIDTPAVVQ